MSSPYSPVGLDKKSGSFLYRGGGYRDVPIDNTNIDDGTRIINEDDLIDGKKKRSNLIIYLIIGGVVLLIIIAVVAYFLFFRGKSSSNNNGTSTFAILGEDCTSKACVSPFLCQQNICKSPLNGPCPQGNGQCASGFVCSAGECKVEFGGKCIIQTDCASGLTCSGTQGICL